MTHRPRIDSDDEADLPDDLLENIEDSPDDLDDFGDETQRNEDYETEEGLEQDEFVMPRDDDE
jgi:hypothetical protein